jgi:hypothetical protein
VVGVRVIGKGKLKLFNMTKSIRYILWMGKNSRQVRVRVRVRVRVILNSTQ